MYIYDMNVSLKLDNSHSGDEKPLFIRLRMKKTNGNNSEDVKKEYFNNLFKDTVVDYHGDRMDFYKNVMNKTVFPMLVDFMYKEVVKQVGKR